MIVTRIVTKWTCAVAKASIEVPWMNYVLITAHFFEIDNPFVSTAFLLAVVSTEGLLKFFISLFVLLLLLLSRDFSLRPHNGTDDIQRGITFLTSIVAIINNVNAIFGAHFTEDIDIQHFVFALQPRPHNRGHIQLDPTIIW